jgi:DNA-binding transcriptional regulator YdaS (Cro superfamily)
MGIFPVRFNQWKRKTKKTASVKSATIRKAARGSMASEGIFAS